MITTETLDRHQERNMSVETMCYGIAWVNRLLGEQTWTRDNNGCGIHPDMPCFDTIDQAIRFFAIFDLELAISFAESDLNADAFLQITHTCDYSSWNPLPPQGQGWVLVSISDAQDCPAAWWLRQQPETCEISQTAAPVKAKLAGNYPVLPKGAEAGSFVSYAVVYSEEDMHAYLDADRLLRPFNTAMDQFFSFSQEEGLTVHETALAAQAAAQCEIDLQREDAAEGWSEAVSDICWGVLRQRAVEKTLTKPNMPDSDGAGALEPVDYVLQDSMGAESAEIITAFTLSPTRHNRVYVAGPMTGIEDHNDPAFSEAAKLLRAAGWHVENPAEHGMVEGAQWADYLHYALGRLATCSALYLLPGWKQSRGASFELIVAKALGMDIGYHHGAEEDDTVVPEDPLDTPLPCEVKIGNMTLRKGVALRLLVTRTKQLFEMATGQSADAVAAQSVKERQRKLLALQVAVGAVVEPAPDQDTGAAESPILMPSWESLQSIEVLRKRAELAEEFSPIEAFVHANEPAVDHAAWRAELFDLIRHYAMRCNVHPGAINNDQFQQWWHTHMLWCPEDDGFEAWKDAVNTGICASALSGLTFTADKQAQPALEALICLALAAQQLDVDSMVNGAHKNSHVPVPKRSLEALGAALDALKNLPNSPANSKQCPADKASWALRDLLATGKSASPRTLTLQK